MAAVGASDHNKYTILVLYCANAAYLLFEAVVLLQKHQMSYHSKQLAEPILIYIFLDRIFVTVDVIV